MSQNSRDSISNLIFVFIYTDMYVCVYVCIYVCVCIYSVCARARVKMFHAVFNLLLLNLFYLTFNLLHVFNKTSLKQFFVGSFFYYYLNCCRPTFCIVHEFGTSLMLHSKIINAIHSWITTVIYIV